MATMTTTFTIVNMHCANCARRITGLLQQLPGVLSADTSFDAGMTVISYDDRAVAPDTLRKAIEEAGYEIAAPAC